MFKSLDCLEINDFVKVISIDDSCDIKKRLLELGVIPGTYIRLLYESFFGDPKAYFVRGSVISIRNRDARKIVVSYE